MAEERVRRKLAAILASDVVGYSRLIRADETGTLARLSGLRRDLIDPEIASHGGRIVKLMGDGMLVEFASIVDAAECAVAMQKGVARMEAEARDERPLIFRIGVNLGDVVIEGDDLHGDGINIAARLQEIAEPGGICLSDDAYRQVRGKIGFALIDGGDEVVKNIADPIHVWRWSDAAPAAPVDACEGQIAGVKRPVGHDQPSIAVLPFQNMSGDPEQEFFADGIFEDIITELSRFKDLFVIARNSAFVYKGRAVSVREVAREFGVDYVVEGSVRKAGQRVRVSAQLIDGQSGRQIWADRYDRRLEDIFDIQDELTAAIVATLPGRIEAASHQRAERKTPGNMAAYEYVLAGKVLHHRSSRADNEEALRMLDRAIELEPKYAHAHAWKACTLGQTWAHGWCEDVDAVMELVIEELQEALALDDNDADVHRILAAVCITLGDHDKAAYHQERALHLNPNYDLIVVQQGELLTWLGSPEEGIDWIKTAMRLNPHHPERFWSHLGRAYYVGRHYADTVDAIMRISSPDHSHHAFLAAACAQMGQAESAKSHVAQVLRADPACTVEGFLDSLHFKYDEDIEHLREGLRKAGLPH